MVVVSPQARDTKGCWQPTEAGRGKEGSPPQPPGGHSRADAVIANVRVLKPSKLVPRVTAITGNKYSWEEVFPTIFQEMLLRLGPGTLA